MSKSVLYSIFFCLGIIAGLADGYFGLWYSPQISSIFLLIKFRARFLILAPILLTGFMIGDDRAKPLLADIVYFESIYGQKLIVTGKVIEDVSYHESGQREFHIDSLSLQEPKNQDVSGRLRIRSYQVNNIYRGDIVLVEGKLNRALGNRHGTIQYANVSKISNTNSIIEDFRLDFFAAINSTIPYPMSALGLGFLVGVGNMLPDNLDKNMRTVGLTHIVAVSGYNLTIIVLLARRLLVDTSKNLAIIVTVSMLAVFLILTGGAPSIVRASIVSALGLTAWYYGRKINPLVLLLVSATISALINPYYIWKDIGWYLSFTAFFGVLVLAPLVTSRLFKSEPKLIGQLLVETSCAQILTFPIIAYIFGDISVIALLANILVLPLVPLSMAVTFVSGISYMILPSVASILSVPARYLLSYVVDVSNLLAMVPGALIEIKISLAQLAAFYSIIVFVCVILYRTNNKQTDEKY